MNTSLWRLRKSLLPPTLNSTPLAFTYRLDYSALFLAFSHKQFITSTRVPDPPLLFSFAIWPLKLSLAFIHGHDLQLHCIFPFSLHTWFPLPMFLKVFPWFYLLLFSFVYHHTYWKSVASILLPSACSSAHCNVISNHNTELKLLSQHPQSSTDFKLRDWIFVLILLNPPELIEMNACFSSLIFSFLWLNYITSSYFSSCIHQASFSSSFACSTFSCSRHRNPTKKVSSLLLAFFSYPGASAITSFQMKP